MSLQNILLSFEGDIKLADFGLAQAAARNPDDDGTLKGKFAYMSPEQVSGRALDGRSDQFSLGVVLYEAFSGQRAFSAMVDQEYSGSILTGELIALFYGRLRQTLIQPLFRDRACDGKKRTDRFPDTGASMMHCCTRRAMRVFLRKP